MPIPPRGRNSGENDSQSGVALAGHRGEGHAVGKPSRAVPVALVALAIATAPAAASPGDLDPTFSNDGWDAQTIHGFTSGNAMAVQADGKIVVVGTTQSAQGNYHFGVLRYLPDGTPDPGFGDGGKVDVGFENGATDADASAAAVAVQSDGKIVVAGVTSMAQDGSAPKPGTEANNCAVARLAPTGVLDTSFNARIGFGANANGRYIDDVERSDDCAAVAVEANGRIVVGGTDDLTADPSFVLLGVTRDGQFDGGFGTSGVETTSFGPASHFTTAITLDPEGRVLLVGQANPDYMDPADNTGLTVIRFASNGHYDRSFSGGAFVFAHHDRAVGVAVQADGKIVVGGRSQTVGGVNRFAALRLGSDGGLDPTYGTGGKVEIPVGGNPEAHALVLQAEGKAVIVGETSLGTNPKNLAAVQLTTDGQPDPAFGNQPGNPGLLVADPSGADEAFRAAAAPGGASFLVTSLAVDKIVTARVTSTPLPALTASDVSMPEGSGGLATATVHVNLDKPSGRPITVDYATAPGSAADGADFSPRSGRLAFAPGETSKTVDVTVAADAAGEPDEDFFLNLTAPSSATIADGQARVVLADDDTPRGGPGGPGGGALPAVQRLTVTRSFRAAPRGASVSAAAAPVGGKVAYT